MTPPVNSTPDNIDVPENSAKIAEIAKFDYFKEQATSSWLLAIS